MKNQRWQYKDIVYPNTTNHNLKAKDSRRICAKLNSKDSIFIERTMKDDSVYAFFRPHSFYGFLL